MTFGPFKCPECGVWWAGFEHRCASPYTSPNTNPPWSPNTTPILPYVGDPPMPYVGDPICTCGGSSAWPRPSCPVHNTWSIS